MHALDPVTLHKDRDCLDHDCMLVGFTTTFAISAYHY
jgi:hypothetical protein